MFEDEKTSCGTAACSFFMFTALYMAVLDMQVRPAHLQWLGISERLSTIGRFSLRRKT